jgi:DNA-binding CsgD family transcriptional regulator
VSLENHEPGTYHGRLLRTLERLLALEATHLAAAMDAAARELAQVLGADKVDVFLYEAASRALVAVGTSATPMGRAERALGLDRLPIDAGGRAVRVFQTGEAYLSRQADQDPEELPAIIEQLGVRSAMYTPLQVGEGPRGVLLVSSAQPEAFDADDLAFLHAVGHWIGLFGAQALHAEALAREAAEAGYRAAAEQLVGALTPRQREIATLIARGYSNAEIARELVVVPGTVANHVEGILTRLGFHNRAQVAAWAAELGLHRVQLTDAL